MSMPPEVGTIDVFDDASATVVAPTGIIGAGGDMWFCSIGNSRVGRVRASSGVVETFADPAGLVRLPANIHPGADGRVWFTCLGSHSLAAIDPDAEDPASTITSYSHPSLDTPVAMKMSTTGALWFSLRGSDAIGTIDSRAAQPMSTLRVVRSPLISDPSALFIDGLGRIWWVNAGSGTIGFLDPDARDMSASVGILGPWPEFGTPRAWAMSPSGRLWLTTQDAPGLLTFDPGAPDPGGTVTWIGDSRLRSPDGVWYGVDGAVWLADSDGNAIVRYDANLPADSAWHFFGALPDVNGPFDIKPSADPSNGMLWFTNKAGNTLGRIFIGASTR